MFKRKSFALIRRFVAAWMRPCRAAFLKVIGLMVLAAATSATYPLVMQWTFNRIEARDAGMLHVIPPLIILVTALRALMLYLQTISTTTLVNRIIADVQETLYRHLLHADLGQLQHKATGTLTSRFSADTEALRTGLNRCLTGFIRDGLTVTLMIGTLFYLDWLLALIVLVVYPLAGIPILNIGRNLRKTAGALQAGIGELTAFLQQSFAGIRMVKSFRLEKHEETRAHNAFTRLFDTLMSASHLRARVDPLLEVVGGFAVAGVLVFGSWRVMSGTGTVGDFTGFVTALLMLMQPVRALGNMNAILQESLAAAERLFTVLDEKPEIINRPSAAPLQMRGGKIEFSDVWFSYEPGASVLNGLNLTAGAGQSVALVGRSGGGKSTIFNLVERFYDVEKGVVSIDGQDMRSMTLASLRDAVTLVSQDAILFNDTVRANIAFGKPDASDEEIRRAAESAEAHGFISAMTQGYDSPVGESGGFLSGGQKQRLVLARAFLRDSPILLLDEATSALDAESEALVQQAIKRLAAGRTTLIIAHRLSTVHRADKICVVDAGRVIEEGRHEELLAKGGLYAELHARQFRQ